MESNYGICQYCRGPISASWFLEEERVTTPDGIQYKTGRTRRAVDYLFCQYCLKKFCVDDSFDGPWR